MQSTFFKCATFSCKVEAGALGLCRCHSCPSKQILQLCHQSLSDQGLLFPLANPSCTSLPLPPPAPPPPCSSAPQNGPRQPGPVTAPVTVTVTVTVTAPVSGTAPLPVTVTSLLQLLQPAHRPKGGAQRESFLMVPCWHLGWRLQLSVSSKGRSLTAEKEAALDCAGSAASSVCAFSDPLMSCWAWKGVRTGRRRGRSQVGQESETALGGEGEGKEEEEEAGISAGRRGRGCGECVRQAVLRRQRV